MAAVEERLDVAGLIALGRDREAAEQGARRARARTTDTDGGQMDALTQFGEVGLLLGGVVGNLGPEDLDRPTPCAEFTVRGVLEHMIGGATAFAAAYRGETPDAVDTTDVLATFGPAMEGLGAAISAPGALTRTVAAPFGEVDGETFARFIALDGLVHGWDLANATGQDYEPTPELVEAVRTFAAGVLDALRDGEAFAAAVEPPAGASPIIELVAFTGRTPTKGWTA
jgi:uncharacterized protein (TIGR03086 family)